MIASRRKEDKQQANVDRSVATTRARRKAKQDARRGINRDSSKPTPMQIETEVKKQQVKTAAAQKGKTRATKKLPPKQRAEERRKQRETNKMVSQARKEEAKKKKTISSVPRPPPKRAIKAAVSAMEGAGFTVPDGMQMVISFAPANSKKSSTKQSTQQQQQKGDAKKPAPKGNRRGRGRN